MPPVAAAIAVVATQGIVGAGIAAIGITSVAGTVAASVVAGAVIGGLAGAATAAITGADIKDGAISGAVVGAIGGGMTGYSAATSASAASTAATTAGEVSLAGSGVAPVTTGLPTTATPTAFDAAMATGTKSWMTPAATAGSANTGIISGGVSPDMAALLKSNQEIAAGNTKAQMIGQGISGAAEMFGKPSAEEEAEALTDAQIRRDQAGLIDLSGVNDQFGRFEIPENKYTSNIERIRARLRSRT